MMVIKPQHLCISILSCGVMTMIEVINIYCF